MHFAAVIAGIVRSHQRHVAIDALLAFGRIVERSGAFAKAAGLPVVVIVEAAEPAVAVHRHVQMNLVAGRAKFRRIQAHERLHERSLVRNGIEERHEVIEPLHVFVLTADQFVQRRVLDGEPAVAHAAVHVNDGMTRGASQPGMRLRRIDLATDRLLEPAVEEDGVIVTAGAPLARLRSHHRLHVLDRLAVELVVERREVVHRALPLLEDILVAPAAGLRVHEEVRWDDAVHVGVGGRGEKRRLRSRAFLSHCRRNHYRIANAVRRIGKRLLVNRSAGG